MQELQGQVQASEAEKEELEKQKNGLEARNRALGREIEALQNDLHRKDQNLAQVTVEKSALQDQLMDLMNQSTLQHSQLHDVLKSQVTS